MNIGYSFWGYLGDLKFDSEGNKYNKKYNPIIINKLPHLHLTHSL